MDMFNNWTVGHAHIAVLGFAGFIGMGAMWQPALIGLVIIAAIVFDVLLKQRGVIE